MSEACEESSRPSGNGAYRVWSFLQEYSLLLIIGAVIALVWANSGDAAKESCHHIVEFNLWTNDFIGRLHHGDGHANRELSVHSLINDVLMALFFAIAGKEVWEAVAPEWLLLSFGAAIAVCLLVNWLPRMLDSHKPLAFIDEDGTHDRIRGMGVVSALVLKFGLPEGMRMSDLFLIGCVAAIGFTVSLFVASVAFPAADVLDGAKMGALLSFGAAIISIVAGRLIGVQKQEFK